MIHRAPFTCLAALTSLVLALSPACGGSSGSNDSALDANKDNVADDLGKVVDADGDGFADAIDINKDGKLDGPGVDTDGDGKADALALDTDCDGFFDSLDVNGDGAADYVTSRQTPKTNVPNCNPGLSGSGGAPPTGGAPNTGGTPAAGSPSGGSPSGGSAGTSPTGGMNATGELGKGVYQGTGITDERYAESDVIRNGVGYMFIANGWGDNWGSHDIQYNGTSFTVKSFTGSQGSNYAPAGYPTMFCGRYSNPPKTHNGQCGLPAAITSLSSVKTGWRWKANGNNGQYNAAWDIWLGNNNSLSSYLMVWLRDPPGQQPAGTAVIDGLTVPGLPGKWKVVNGSVSTPQGTHPIVNYVRAEGDDLGELEFDVLALYNDAKQRGYNLPGSQILAVAIGFEIWNGPVSNLVTEDFYVTVK